VVSVNLFQSGHPVRCERLFQGGDCMGLAARCPFLPSVSFSPHCRPRLSHVPRVDGDPKTISENQPHLPDAAGQTRGQPPETFYHPQTICGRNVAPLHHRFSSFEHLSGPGGRWNGRRRREVVAWILSCAVPLSSGRFFVLPRAFSPVPSTTSTPSCEVRKRFLENASQVRKQFLSPASGFQVDGA
jgi:hypothetical protein